MGEPPAGKRVAIVQSNYIPWKGYFDLIGSVDEFVLLDDAQFTRRDWRNRNRIKTPQGTRWLTIPVDTKGKYHQAIQDTRVSDPSWNERHWQLLVQAYSKAPCFGLSADAIEATYRQASDEHLSQVNRLFLDTICDILGIDTKLSWSSDYDTSGAKSEKLVRICERAGATEYLSGPSAASYLDESLFADAGIEVKWMDYGGYPEYDQLYPPFEHQVTVLDLIFHTGADAPDYMLSLPHR